MTGHARIHAFEPRSRANGPGARFVVWFQGCTLGCPGCFNPTTHDPAAGRSVAIDELAAELARARPGIESGIVTPDLLLKEIDLTGSAAGERPAPVLPKP